MSVNYNPSVVTSGLVLNLDAANIKSYPASGTSWFDLSGNGNTGTLTNGPTFNSANGGSLVFNGVNHFTQLGSISQLQFTNSQAYTLSAWVYWSPTSAALQNVLSYGKVFGLSPSAGDFGYYFSLDNGALRSGSFLFDYYDGTIANSIQGNANVVPINTWTHLVGINNGTNSSNGFYVYINGVLAASTIRQNNTVASINYSVCNLNVGARDSKATFQGKISQASAYQRALSSQEILQNFNAMRGRYGL